MAAANFRSTTAVGVPDENTQRDAQSEASPEPRTFFNYPDQTSSVITALILRLAWGKKLPIVAVE